MKREELKLRTLIRKMKVAQHREPAVHREQTMKQIAVVYWGKILSALEALDAQEGEPLVVIQIKEDYSLDFHVTGNVRAVVVDENIPNDRSYELLNRCSLDQALSVAGPEGDWGRRGDDKHQQATTRISYEMDGIKAVPSPPKDKDSDYV